MNTRRKNTRRKNTRKKHARSKNIRYTNSNRYTRKRNAIKIKGGSMFSQKKLMIGLKNQSFAECLVGKKLMIAYKNRSCAARN